MRTIRLLLSIPLVLMVAAAAEPVRNRAPLAKTKYTPLPLGSVRPAGWLERQLRIQADGLTGHLEEFWPDLGPNSAWLGGAGEGWERGPYYLDGLAPLAYLLDDPKLVERVRRWVNWTLENQRADGGIGPEKNKDWWPNFVQLKVLTQYQEATGDARVIPLMERYFAYMAKNIDQQPLKLWAISRWQDQVLSILWLYNRNGDAKLLDLARKLRQQGNYWPAQFENFTFKQKVSKEQARQETHVVNNAQALKTGAVWYQVTGDRKDLDGMYNQFRQLDRYHGFPTGIQSGDEHYAGTSPVQGAELCSVVEAMFSLEHVIAVTGDAAFADRLEKVTYNSLPATLSADMWSHQYDQQPNQVLVSKAKRDWTTNGPDSNLFGLEPNFGCCTANMHQGWPKFVSHMWMAAEGGGLAVVAYGPNRVTAKLGAEGVPVTIEQRTAYPFQDRVELLIAPQKETSFPLELRIPAWAKQTALTVNGRAVNGVKAGAYHLLTRTWKKGDRVEIRFGMRPSVSRWFNDAVVVERGPLVFSLKIGEKWEKVKEHPRAPDWAVHPTTPWNYALMVNEVSPEKSFEVVEKALGDFVFSPDGAPVELKAKARRLPQWTMANDSAAPPPKSPVTSTEPEETVTLIPYGSAKLRITEFPSLGRPRATLREPAAAESALPGLR